MEKVKVSKEVFDALNEIKNNGGFFEDLIYTAYKFSEKTWSHRDFAALNEIDFKTYLDCAYHGYEVETVLEDCINILLSVHSGFDSYDRGFRDGLILISRKLGIGLDHLK